MSCDLLLIIPQKIAIIKNLYICAAEKIEPLITCQLLTVEHNCRELALYFSLAKSVILQLKSEVIHLHTLHT